ncbi:MAG TPA: hypothetical protein VG602_00900 [Actinomycetota bacterium]|nr:hypothetical protein [Actinomycetota bacterium]
MLQLRVLLDGGWLATRVRNRKTLLLLMVIVPFWTSILIRTYAWSILLSPQGPLRP